MVGCRALSREVVVAIECRELDRPLLVRVEFHAESALGGPEPDLKVPVSTRSAWVEPCRPW
jgi:hypothetical protein